MQKRATRLISGFLSLSYEERFNKLDLTTLERRRLRWDLVEVLKILKIIVILVKICFFHTSQSSLDCMVIH